ncbi:uncharacterized protein LOC119365668 [Triticum dicoccoides]|uniref:uncharacterized protein LOC119365668 n=1 Tax=Triticum dicoccoides TaxID=85692 RepID=UPI00188FDD1F|nr:uncharacterized protein LOC119365668 [Triticum dicoccoides]
MAGSTTRPMVASLGCSSPRRGGMAATLRASLVEARTATEEAVNEVVLRQAALVEDLQGRPVAREAEASGTSSWSRTATSSSAGASSVMPTTAAASLEKFMVISCYVSLSH